MKTSIVTDISPLITYLEKFWFSSYKPKCSWSIELSAYLCHMHVAVGLMQQKHFRHFRTLKCDISRKRWMMNFLFAMSRNIEIFYKLILPSWVCVSRHAQSTQNNKLATSSQYLKKNRKNEANFLLADKHQRFLRIDTIILGVYDQACPNYTK